MHHSHTPCGPNRHSIPYHTIAYLAAPEPQLLADSKEVDPAALESGRAYLQVTYVEPFFNEHELKRRTKFFEQTTNVKQFM